MAALPEGKTRTVSRKQEKLKEPEDYRVVLLNDHYTTMDFVVEILRLIFHKSEEDACRIMMDIHHRGSGTAWVYSWDIAQTKAYQVHERARELDFPLRCVVEAL